MRYLPYRVNACIRSSATRNPYRFTCNCLDCFFKFFLYGNAVWLNLPA